jgi:DUF4097 and DUF4098 domain-containing protein YvlB
MEPRSFATPDGLQLEVRISSGSIEVETADTTETTLEVVNERDPDDFRIELTELSGGGHRLVVEEHRRKAFSFGFSKEVQVRVHCPHGTTVQADSASADLEVHGRAGALTFRSGSGDLAFDESDGDVTTKTGSGDVQGRHARGSLVANSGSGDIQVGRVEGDLVARSASGDIQVGASGPSVQITTASGDVQVDGLSRGEATLRSVSGDVQVGVVPGTKVWLDLSSVSGDTVSDLAMGDGPGAGETAALELRASTVSGDIRVRSASSSGA